MRLQQRLVLGLFAIIAASVIAGCAGGEETTPTNQVQATKAKKDAKDGGK